MPCYYPQSAYRLENGDVTAISNKSNIANAFKIPCGQCSGCRLERSRQWAIRILHEASLYENNCFLTLTYHPDHLPKNGTLVKKHFQDFMKRFRKKYKHIKIRNYYCGEYGEKKQRPHYHAIIFNFDFNDKIKDQQNPQGDTLYVSKKLNDLWQLGDCWIGAVTFESAAYVARYIMKKQTGKNAFWHYNTINPDTGEILERIPEFTDMSRRPGIGKPWLEKYKTDVYPDDFVIVRGKKMKPPKYYDKNFALSDPDIFMEIENKRNTTDLKKITENTARRLKVREQVHKSRINKYKRDFENET